jgi:hypothetical protein
MNKGGIGGMNVEFDAVNGQPGGLVFVGDHLAGVVTLLRRERPSRKRLSDRQSRKAPEQDSSDRELI